ncbi:MAG TPA: T9SS type A sorting domain-containing protein [Chitinophagales bacterium]|nr:T9SS type A sorting domain-containing protein [Chitinophagales bacterium]
MTIYLFKKKLTAVICSLLFSSPFTSVLAQEFNWAQYIGGDKGDYIEEVAVDHHGNIIVSGQTSSTGMATNGAYQTTKSGANDFFISKYRSNGTLVWCTYYGGNDKDYLFAMTIDASDNIYVGGETKSTSGVASSGAYQTTNGGDWDALLVKFDSSGNRKWATYFGGNKVEQLLCCATDERGNIYIGGYTQSTSNVATPNGYQTTYGGGEGDAFVAKFGPAGVIKWATYYGGELEDRFHGLEIDHKGNVITCGTTPSLNGIATSGAFQTTSGGANDAFLAKFTGSGGLQWATYYGSYGSERGRECSVDNLNNIYVTGFTTSDSLMATPGAYQYKRTPGINPDSSATNEMFLAKFSSSGNRIWSTYYGGKENETPRGVVWHNGLLAVSGLTESKTKIATSDALQPHIGGGQDAYVAVFTDDGSREWATYYGGAENEMLGQGYGPDVDFDADGNLVVAFTTLSDSLPALNSFYGDQTHTDGMLVTITTNFFQRLQQNNFSDINPALSIYPNPARKEVSIVIESYTIMNAVFRLNDLSGKTLMAKNIFLKEGENMVTLDLHSFQQGCYITSVILEDGRILSQKLMKQ